MLMVHGGHVMCKQFIPYAVVDKKEKTWPGGSSVWAGWAAAHTKIYGAFTLKM